MERVLGLLSEVVAYGAVSLVALVVDAGLLLILVERANWHYLPASVAAFIVGAGVAYVLSVRFVFRARRIENRALEFSYFMGVGIIGVFVNAVVLSVGISLLGMSILGAKLLSALCTFVSNFSLRRAILFSAPRSAS